MFRWMKSRIFNATPNWRPCLSTNFFRRTRNFKCTALRYFALSKKSTFVKEHSHTGPRQNTFFYLRPEKRHVGPKNNSKQLLRRCCYTHSCPFARKMIFECAVTCYRTLYSDPYKKTEKMLPHTFVTLRQSTSSMNFFIFLRLGMIKRLKETVALLRKSKMLIFECAVTCYRTL